MLSVVIPSYRDPLLHKTIDSILTNFEGEFEIIPVIDGYELKQPLSADPRVKPIFHTETKGMREAINTGVRAAQGEYLMRTDEHCMFAPGFDTTILRTIQPNWIVVPRRYSLDVERWEVMDLPPSDFEKLSIVKYERGTKFSGVGWKTRSAQLSAATIASTMAMQGSCWVMPKQWWVDVIGELQSEGYGTHYQDSHEMVFKTWKAGGHLMLNKETWYAHKHRSFPRTHGYGGELADKSFAYCLDTWRDYYENEVRPAWQI